MIKHKTLIGTGDFTEINGEKKEVFLAVLRPTAKLLASVEKLKALTWTHAVKDGYLLLSHIDSLAKDLGLFSDDKVKKAQSLADAINAGELALKKGGIRLWGLGEDVVSGQKIAVQMIRDRSERNRLFDGRNTLVEKTAETLAETVSFNYLVAESVVWNEDKSQYFKNVEEYNERAEEPFVQKITTAASEFFYGSNLELVKKLPEYTFLLSNKMCNDDLRLVDKYGEFIDFDGRRIDAEGYFVNKDGDRTDKQGNVLSAEGEYIVEASPFLDDDDMPIGNDLVEEVVDDSAND